MPLIQKEVKIERESVPFRLPKELAAKIALYANFIESSRDYVVSEILQYVIGRDREFAAWCKQHETDIPGTSELSDPASKGRGRPRGKSAPQATAKSVFGITNSQPQEAAHVPQNR